MRQENTDPGHVDHCSNAEWQALRACVTEAGIMHTQEIKESLALWQSKQQTPSTTLPPYVLTALPGHAPTAALRWDWDGRCAGEFAAWCTESLRDRFGVHWQIESEDEDAQMGPRYLRMTLNGQQERCDWRYLNHSRWMGAFCTITDRLLGPVGLTALSLETGWFDTVVVFCRKSHAQEVLRWFPEAE